MSCLTCFFVYGGYNAANLAGYLVNSGFQVVWNYRLLLCLLKNDSSFRDGDASQRKRLPFGMFCVSTVQPQVTISTDLRDIYSP